MADVDVDEDAASREPNTREESQKSGQAGPKVLFRSGLSNRKAFTATNRRNCGRGLGVVAQKYVESLQHR